MKFRRRKITVLSKLIIAGVVLLLLLGGLMLTVRSQYNQNLESVSSSQEVKLITVDLGASVPQIAKLLKDQGLIRKTWTFEWYVRNNGLQNELKAGTYALTPSQDVASIAKTLSHGKVATDLVTITPGRRLDQVRAILINAGFTPDEVDESLKPAHYADHPALNEKPADVGLEGYLYPESFQKTTGTTAQDIIRLSLDEMQKRLTSVVRNGIAAKGLNVYQGITLASIIEQEASNQDDRRIVAQVFLKRLAEGKRLESDPTAKYGAILAGKEPSLTYDSAYNTYKNAGLPPTPISSVSEVSLRAVINPSDTNFLYFVAGDDGRTHFSRTLQEHEALAEQYCKKLCGN